MSEGASIKELLIEILTELNRSAGVNASAVVSRDGLLMSSVMPEDIDAEAFAAMTATMLGAAETAFSELKKGVAERVIVEGTHAKIIAMGAGPKALIVVLTDPDAPLGLALLKISDASRKIAKLLE